MKIEATVDREDVTMAGSCMAIIVFCVAASYYNDHVREEREARQNRILIESQLKEMGYENDVVKVDRLRIGDL